MSVTALRAALASSSTLLAMVGALPAGGCTQSAQASGERSNPVVRISDDPLVYVVLIASKGDELLFDVDSFDVPSGAEVRLTFRNTARAMMMYHNLLIVEKGSEERVALRAIPAGFERGWVPDMPEILVATRALQPGEEETVTFIPRAPGTYPYLCTVPGHAISMRGVMRVR